MSQNSERLEQINRQQADDYWVLVRHEVCASYLGVHVVPVPYLEDAERYDLLNVLLKRSEDAHSRLLQRKSFFPLGPLKEMVTSADSRNLQVTEQRVKHKAKYTDDFDHEEVVIDEGALKSIKLIVKNVNKEVSLFFLKPKVLRVSDTLPWVCSVRSLYIVYEVFYTTNIQLLVTDRRLTQRFKSQSRIPIGFLCRKFRLEASGLIGEELTMRKSPRRANFVNSSSTVHRTVVGRHTPGTGEAPGAPAQSAAVPRPFWSILPDCCLSRSRADVKPSGAAPGRAGPVARNGRGSEQPAAPSAPRDPEAAAGDPSKSKASGNRRGGGSAGVASPRPLRAKSLITLMSPPHPTELTQGGRHGAPGSDAPAGPSPSPFPERLSIPPRSDSGSPSALRPLGDTAVLSQNAAEYSASPQSVADSLDVPQKLAESSASPQSVADSLLVPQKLAEYSASPQSVADSLDVPQKFAEYSASPQSVADSLDVPQKLAEYSASPQSVADSLDVPQKFAEYSASPQSVADSLDVPQKFAEYSASPQSVADSLDVPHTAAKCINLPQLIAESLLVQQTVAGAAASPQSIAASPLAQAAPAGSAAPQRSVAAPRWFADTGAGCSLPPPCAERLSAGGQPAARPTTSSASSSNCSSPGGAARPPAPRYRDSEPGEMPARRTDPSALIPTIQDLICLLQTIVLSQQPPPCSCPTPPAARRPRLSPQLGRPWGTPRAQDRRAPSPSTSPQPAHAAPGTRRPSPARRRPLPSWTPGSSSSTEPEQSRPQPQPRPLPAPLREADRPVHCLPDPSDAPLREAARPVDCLPEPSDAPLREAARPVDYLPVSSPAPFREADRLVDYLPVPSPATLMEAARPVDYLSVSSPAPLREAAWPRCRILAPSSDSEGVESPAGPSPRDRGLGIPSVAIAQPSASPSPGCPPASAPGRCLFCGPALAAETRGVRAALVPGRLPDCEQEWERHWAAARPEPGADPVLRSLTHMMPTSSDSEAEERAAGAGR